MSSEFKKMLNQKNLMGDFKMYQQSNEISFALESATAEFMSDNGDTYMFFELNDNGDPGERVADFLMEEDDE